MSGNSRLQTTAFPFRFRWRTRFLALVVLLIVGSVRPGPLLAQQPPPPAVEDQSREAINADIVTRMIALERERLERLTRLAARQPLQEAYATYEELFRLAIANNLYRFAEPAAERLLTTKDLPANLQLLAGAVNIIGEADRGDYEESYSSLKTLVQSGASNPAAPVGEVSVTTALAVIEAYYQRLMRSNQLTVARKALEMLIGAARMPEVRAYAENRLGRLKLVGQNAPPIQGADLDGKPVDPKALQGRVVLLIFWATWHAPDLENIRRAEEILAKYQSQGLSIVGINVDGLDEKAGGEAAVREDVKKYLLDYNITWPNVLARRGPGNTAEAYHVQEIPALVLIGRDGKVVHPDLFKESALEVVLEALKAPPR